MADTRTLVPRSQKVLFYGVPAASGDTITYHRMKGFTDVSTSKNAKEYTRQYVDELFEQTDVTGYSPSTSYGFDQYAGDPVHADIVKITDNELIGSNAVRSDPCRPLRNWCHGDDRTRHETQLCRYPGFRRRQHGRIYLHGQFPLEG